ncbi:acyltransferase [Actinoplanes sp. NPDC089786]|uniref:acyltransferase family protein n=1 Tax=Actinoplanes sp. NPDC089786 TaxID=3155185 RepID=UPI0034301DE6
MRNRYLDLLRAAAVVRVVVYHVTGLPALTVLFPAMPIMFALGGSMMAASLDRMGPFAVEKRLRRLLPSVWVLSAIAVPAMMIDGLAWDWKLLMWFFPLEDPPAGGTWLEALSAMWYLRDFLWFVLLSPILLPLYRKFPLVTIATPYAALIVTQLLGLTVHPPLLRDLALYGGAWLIGFAHHDGKLRDRRLLWVAAAAAAAAAVWVVTHPGPRGYDLNDIPLGNGLWSLALILVLLRFSPSIPAWRPVTVLNARALTIYLWHVPIIVAMTHAGEAAGWPVRGWTGDAWRMAVVLSLLGLATLAFGWVEDLAAGRRVTLVPADVVLKGQDERHDVHGRPGPSHVLRARVRQHSRRVAHLGRQYDLPARRRVEQLRGVRR